MNRLLKSKTFLLSSILIVILIAGGVFLASNKGEESDKEATLNTESTSKRETPKEKKIHSTAGRIVCWAINPKDTKEILESSDDRSPISVVKASVKSIEDAVFFKETENFSPTRPFTPVKVELQNKLHGVDVGKLDTVYLEGGDASIFEIMKTIESETAEKMGYSDLSESQQKEMYVSYKDDYDYNLSLNKEYVFILVRRNNGVYTIFGNGYGTFLEVANNPKTFKNVITGSTLVDENGKEITLTE